jgi:hypothetical protein
MRAPAAAALVGALACRSTAPPLYPAAGAHDDDGHGELAQASIRLLTSEHTADDPAAPPPPRIFDLDEDEVADPDAVLGLATGAFGGALYADYVVPPWPALHFNRRPRYHQSESLSGAVEGVITWRGAVPGTLATACGAVAPVTAGAGHALAGVLVYIEKVSVGRTLPSEGKPANVGGLVVKRGCALAPAMQIATPLPAALTVHGDGKPARLRVTPPDGAVARYDLEAGGRASLQLQAGLTRVEADDGSLAAAWVFAADTPYYAVTDDQGRFRLDELPSGVYDVTAWHSPVPALVNGALSYGAPIVARRSVQIVAGQSARLDLAIGP